MPRDNDIESLSGIEHVIFIGAKVRESIWD